MRKFLRKDFICFWKHTTLVALPQRTKPKRKRSFPPCWLISCPERHGRNAALNPSSGSHVVSGVVSGVTVPIREAAVPKRVKQDIGTAQVGPRECPLQQAWLLENKRKVR